MHKTSVALSRKHLAVLKKFARAQKRSVSFILQEIVETKARELNGRHGQQK